ncbi:putative quinol monooxygenase [Mesorhizobium escarrei]|uniref:ABM domain-containing protein n=1 Tax=Mesorhizobium escarrei TaxID=666018 RepID=A0ABM9DHU7_9HYPH|nr:putative quinol monooxygenase [Mesorhizobium escarrei]CAH2396156.1 hypothetical protein MES5069_130082 [Mesorhizobium escarrei]
MCEFVVVVSNHVKPGHEAEYVELVTPVLDAMRHEKTFINTVLNRDPEDPTRFMLYETWADKADFLEVQMTREYRKTYEARLPEILRAPRVMQYWEPIREDFAFFAPRGDAPNG